MEQLNKAVSKKIIHHCRKHDQHCGGAFHLSRASSFYDVAYIHKRHCATLTVLQEMKAYSCERDIHFVVELEVI